MTPSPFDPAPSWARASFSPDPNPSFFDLLKRADPGMLPKPEPGTVPSVPTGTTILALRFADGVLVGGDRRATEGNVIADRRIEKVYPADDYSAVAIAGVAGAAIDIVRILQLELSHYEKLEGEMLSLEGKANKLAQMIKMNLPMAMQGIVVIPLFGGYDTRRQQGRIFRYDAIGGRYEEIDFHATGSGGVYARDGLKKRFSPGMSRDDAVRAAVDALIDASEEDSATGGPDLARGIFPIIATVTAAGYQRASEEELRALSEELLAARRNA